MTEVYRKHYSRPIYITPEMKARIQEYRDSLIEIANNPELSSEFDARTINIVLNELNDYDRNFILAYYAIANGVKGDLAKAFNCTFNAIHRRIIEITNKIKELNDTPRTTYNQPRANTDN